MSTLQPELPVWPRSRPAQLFKSSGTLVLCNANMCNWEGALRGGVQASHVKRTAMFGPGSEHMNEDIQ